MIKNTLCFSNPAYLSLRDKQLVIKMPEVEKSSVPDSFKKDSEITRPIEDLGVVILENRQITITSGAIEALLENNCAVITCDSKNMPVGLMLPLCGNSIQNERFRKQIDASLPLQKQLWQQTVANKINNQATVLEKHTREETKCMRIWSTQVRSGDPDNLEARAAAYYWRCMFPNITGFTRGKDDGYPNNFLNYGYAILRAIIARSLVCNGLLPTLGIHHHNRYNAYCLADDIMEPYRPFVDEIVIGIVNEYPDKGLTNNVKRRLLSIPTIEVSIGGKRRPLMVAAGQTTYSLFRCFNGELRKIIYPEL
jgi:CRISPR-associated protein Cas1